MSLTLASAFSVLLFAISYIACDIHLPCRFVAPASTEATLRRPWADPFPLLSRPPPSGLFCRHHHFCRFIAFSRASICHEGLSRRRCCLTSLHAPQHKLFIRGGAKAMRCGWSRNQPELLGRTTGRSGLRVERQSRGRLTVRKRAVRTRRDNCQVASADVHFVSYCFALSHIKPKIP